MAQNAEMSNGMEQPFSREFTALWDERISDIIISNNLAFRSMNFSILKVF
jgi:hypothetical protein